MSAPCFQSQLKDPQWTQDEINAIKKFAHAEYIDKGVEFDDMIRHVSDDLGVRPDFITRAIGAKGNTRPLTDAMYRKMSLRRDAVRNAKNVVRTIDAPGYAKLAAKIWNIPRSALTAFHWAVFPVTHAGDLVYRPTTWNNYFKTVFDAWRFASRAAHERAMLDHVNSPNYMVARRGGLMNDPKTDPVGILTSMRGASRRGFDSLKILRQKLFDKEWEKTKPADRTPESAKHLSEMINHATGAVSGKVPLSKLQFAPQLTASKWMRAVVDPIKTVRTFSNWKNATAGERLVALRRIRNAGEFAATYAGLLAINQGLNMALGSKDKINATDPTKSDFLQFKIGGHIVGIGAGVREVYNLLGAVGMLGQKSRKELYGDTALAAITKKVGRYAMNKLEPTLGAIVEGVSGEDRLTGRPLPFSSKKETPGKPRMTWAEYGLSHFAPIPLTGATREAYDSMRQRGLSAMDSTAILKAAAIMATEATGARNYEPQQHQPQPTERRQTLNERERRTSRNLQTTRY